MTETNNQLMLPIEQALDKAELAIMKARDTKLTAAQDNHLRRALSAFDQVHILHGQL